MRTDPRADDVRTIVERVFSRYSAGKFPRLYRPEEEQAGPSPAGDRATGTRIDESIVIDQGRYVARTYRTEGQMAMWLVAAGILQFYDDRGRMLATINLFRSVKPQRLAA